MGCFILLGNNWISYFASKQFDILFCWETMGYLILLGNNGISYFARKQWISYFARKQ